MHANEIDINLPMVHKLIATQFPQWANLPIIRFASAGTDNAIFRLGDTLMARLPLTEDAAMRIAKEHEWLPKLAALLPLEVPVPLALGKPTIDYPVPWSIYPWLKGETANIESMANPHKTAIKLANFINALHSIDAKGGPAPGPHNFFRGVPLANRNSETRSAINALQGEINTAAVTEAWESALAAPVWSGPPTWIHGDLLPSNLLFQKGELTAVIDFGGLGVGDPACDLITAWCLFSKKDRDLFRSQLNIDDATWARGRGWALSIGLIALPYYKVSNPAFAKIAAHMIQEALIDHK